MLPLGRIKKIMKIEEFAMQLLDRANKSDNNNNDEGHHQATTETTKFMISAEAPALMTKACELIIREISTRAWQHTDSQKRKTLNRADIHSAVIENEVFDFLIDIIPRVTTVPTNSNSSIYSTSNTTT